MSPRPVTVRLHARVVRLRRLIDFMVDATRLRMARLRSGTRQQADAVSMQPGDGDDGLAIAPAREPPTSEDFPAFPDESAPLVSIVVPVFNHLDQTMRCLRSLARVGAQCSFEVVVVDDGSTDGSAEWLAECPQLRLQRMPHNSGFVAACNAGANAARGRYLVFLNNDTEVTAGWLDAMIACFDSVPRCGLVGAKLIYPDGSLQEAGGIVFADGNALNYGRGDDPRDPRFDFLREVDYCSGACLAVPRKLFLELGGFDVRYAPAYYEDTDLAFAIREAGYLAVYQPRAEVVHFEGKTAGTDVASGIKRFQEINRGKFVDKWRQVLAGQPTPEEFAASPGRCAARGRGTQVLVVDADFPRPDRDSGSLRMFSMLLLLRELGCHVRFWAVDARQGDRYALELEQRGVELVMTASRAEALRWWYQQGAEQDLIVLSRLPVAMNGIRWARRYASQAMVVFDTVDLHFLRIGRGAAVSGSRHEAAWAERLKRAELGLAKKADLTLVVSDYERSLLRELVPAADVRVLSNVHPVHGRTTAHEERSGLLFLGNFQHEPNLDAALWLIAEVMPRLRERLPGTILNIVGYGASEALGDRVSADVVVHGFVADLTPMLSEVRLALAPLRYGAGVKGKVNMAMSHGVPVVTTSIGAEGMGLVHRRDAMIANSAEDFVAAIAEAYSDGSLWLELSDRGLENVRSHFSTDVARQALQDVLGLVNRR